MVAALLLSAQSLTGYTAPAAPPAIAFLPQGELALRACAGPCAVYGWFPPGHTIYLDERLDPLEDLQARAILLHELVHFLQQENGALAGPRSCRTWLKREHEAFEVERRWLIAQPGAGGAGGLARARAPRVPLGRFCRDEPPAQEGAKALPARLPGPADAIRPR
ncbi:MAG: hypothetical protein WD341_14465 [Tistlia sp.]|uniref:hypothetical protein n=1 Tax=Tistlia sp. TaxID=3057121 RepID=UPI0034A3380D